MEQISVNHRCFRVERLLGKGKGGYSYLVSDSEGLFVVKQIHHEPCSYYSFGDKLASEREDYARLWALGIPMPRMLDVDEVYERILKEYIDGPTIQELADENAVSSEYIAQVREMCSRLYPAGLNIDYYPTNFVVQDGTLFYIDYECNGFMPQWSFEEWGIHHWLRDGQVR